METYTDDWNVGVSTAYLKLAVTGISPVTITLYTSPDGINWTSAGDKTDNIYNFASGYPGIEAYNSSDKLDNWVGGPIVAALSITTTAASSITNTMATSGGSYTNASNPTHVGVCWSTSANPTTADSHTDDTVSSPFTSSITGISASTLHHIRAYVIDDAGTTYGDDKTFTTLRNPITAYMAVGGSITDPANIVSATGASYPTNYMTLACHNSAALIPDDVIKVIDKGGTYNPTLNSPGLVPPSDGTSGHPIVYEAVSGESPTIDMSYDIGTASGCDADWGRDHTKAYSGSQRPRVVWEDGVVLENSTDATCADGNWYYTNGSGILTYKPTSGTPGSHTSLFFIQNSGPGGEPYAVDLRERNYIDVSGLTVNRGSIGVGQGASSASTTLTGINVHSCTFNYSPWAIYGSVWQNNCVFSNSNFYNNTINWSECGISVWTNSLSTAHTAHVDTVSIHDNIINHHFSIDSTHNWAWARIANWNTNGQNLNDHAGTDHEGFSFQDQVNCSITKNTITCDMPLVYPDFPEINLYVYKSQRSEFG